MTREQLFKNTDMLLSRRCLTESEVLERLSSIYDEHIVQEAIREAKLWDVWVDAERHVVVICTDRPIAGAEHSFVILATGKDYPLVKE